MEKIKTHSSSPFIWLILSFFFFSNAIIAHPSGTIGVDLSFCKTEASTVSIITKTATPIKKAFPDNSSTENHVISHTDTGENIDFFAIKNNQLFTVTPFYTSKQGKINYKETYNMQFHPNIVPPPPEV